MEEFFYNQPLDPILSWLEEPEPLAFQQSAFAKYTTNGDLGNKSCNLSINDHNCWDKNINKRMIVFLRNSWDHDMVERDRRFKHMINERTRREKHRNGYSAVHALLPPGTKNEKKNVVHVATSEIIRLRSSKLELEKRKGDLEAILAAREKLRLETELAKIRLRV